MTGLKMLGCLTFLAIFVTLNATDGQLSVTTKTQMRLGIKDVQSALDYGATLLEKLKPMAGALGIFGAFLTFAMLFVPSQESAEMKFMKKEFAEINMKLDRISSQIDYLKALVKYETQRSQYVGSANKIMFGYNQLQKFQDEMSASTSCATEKECKRERLLIAQRYVESFNIKEHLYKIMKGTAGPGTVFGDPLLELINNYYRCDINRVFHFADGVIKLAFKGQHVVLAHEKLTGTNQSISSAMMDWSQMAYNIRKKADEIKLQCYQDIDTYMDADIKDTKYQTGFQGNKEAGVALKTYLDRKYPWVLWTVLSNGVYDTEGEYGFQLFLNKPTKGPKRVLRVIASENGTYSSQLQISSWIERAIQQKIKYNDADDAKSMFDIIKREVGTAIIEKNLLSLGVLRHYDDLEVVAGSSVFKLYSESRRTQTVDVNLMKRISVDAAVRRFKIWAMFKSDEQIAGVHEPCKLCRQPNTCKTIPYTSKSYCLCSNFFYGENCENYDTISLAANIEKMLTVTARIPTVADVYFEVEDMQEYLGVSLHNIEKSIAQLNIMLQEKLTTGFQWTNLLTAYSASFDKLTYYLHRFQILNSSDPTYETLSKALATSVVDPDNIHKWVYDLNFMIVGRNTILITHKPLIFFLMQSNKNTACDTNYKEFLDTAWQKIVALQTQAYIMWATSLAILQKPSDEITSMYHQKVLNQTSVMEKTTCELTILNSVNVNCSGGYYMYSDMTLKNQCDENYYLVGNSTVTCDKPSSCHACDCDPQGSSSQECHDQTGKCDCNNKFYGDKCNNRDCAWSSWRYGACGFPCYGEGKGMKTILRSQETPKYGKGKECSGYWRFYDECPFHRCTGQDLINNNVMDYSELA